MVYSFWSTLIQKSHKNLWIIVESRWNDNFKVQSTSPIGVLALGKQIFPTRIVALIAGSCRYVSLSMASLISCLNIS